MKGKILFFIAIYLLIFISPRHAAAAPLRFPASGVTPGEAVLEVQADELVTMTSIPFSLTIRDEAGRRVTGAQVQCALTMPSMVMPENRPKMVERDGGTYAGEMILTCTMGDWRMSCTATPPDATPRVMTFDIGKARMK